MKLFDRPAPWFVVVAWLAMIPGAWATAPAGRYTISGGTVYDTKTRLTWQQTLSTTTYTWADAQSYCASLPLAGGGWRVPSVKELLTLVDFSVAPGSGTATIDATAFPNTPATGFWSSTPVAGSSSNAWGVDFHNGGTDSYGVGDNYIYVRCVR